jgi:stearoyl-CoA desaturase (delta-9 desaturase)
MGWILTGRAMHRDRSELLPYVPDLRKDKFHLWISKWHVIPSIVVAIIFYFIGGWPWVFWGVFVRSVMSLHFTWLVNSATHIWGSQRFDTGDMSTNSLWVAILTFGEGWHNNHHAHPQAARHGHRWYEVDMNWYGIWTLRTLGLAWDIKRPKLESEPAGRLAA